MIQDLQEKLKIDPSQLSTINDILLDPDTKLFKISSSL